MSTTDREIKVWKYVDSTVNGFRHFPPSLHVALTDRCFNHCVTCGHWKRKDKKSIDWGHLRGLLEYGLTAGLETVCFTGGDPFKYPEINSAMGYCIDNGLKFGIVTAGHKPAWVHEDLIKHAEWVRCSIDATGENYKKVRGACHASWKSVLESLNRMRAAGCNLQAGITISTANQDYLLRTLKWVYESDLFGEVRTKRVYKHCGQPLHSIDEEAVDRALDSVRFWHGANAQLDYRDFSPEPIKHCWAVHYQLFINPDGGIYPCCITAGDTESKHRCKPLGNIYDTPHNRIHWNPALYDPNDKVKNHGQKVLEFSQLPADQLPKCCKTDCIERLNIINRVCASVDAHQKNFF